MTLFELTLYTSPVSEGQADELIDEFDASIGTLHSGQTSIDALCEGRSAVDAGKSIAVGLRQRGIDIVKFDEDLVTRSDIARRLQTSRQAVNMWVSGERREGFPAPSSEVAGGVWCWGDVLTWAHRGGLVKDLDAQYAQSQEIRELNAWLGSDCGCSRASVSAPDGVGAAGGRGGLHDPAAEWLWLFLSGDHRPLPSISLPRTPGLSSHDLWREVPHGR